MIACSCGSTVFGRTAENAATERQGIDMSATDPQSSMTFDTIVEETMEATPWECVQCHTIAPDDVQDAIERAVG